MEKPLSGGCCASQMARTYYMAMSKLFTVSTIVYLTVAATAGISALVWTLWAYNLDNRMVSDTVTAAIINTAAAMAAMGFFGGFDMVLSIWQFFRNQEAEKARNQEREENASGERTNADYEQRSISYDSRNERPRAPNGKR